VKDTTPKTTTDKQLIVMFLMIFLALCLCGGFAFLVLNKAIDGWVSYLDVDGRIISFHQAVLSAAEQPNATIPEEFRYDVLQGCWEFLQEAIQTHGNDYTLSLVGIWGDEGTPIGAGTGSTVSVVEVVFSDGARMALQTYAYTLETCRYITDE
jgi:hypothetical protein